MLRPCEFPSAPTLGSICSAGRFRPLFAGFTATMVESDFSKPFVIGFELLLLPLRPHTTAGRFGDLLGPGAMLLNVPWFFDPGMPSFASPIRLGSAAFDHLNSLGASEFTFVFEAQWPGPRIPLSTLRLAPRGAARMTRGESGG